MNDSESFVPPGLAPTGLAMGSSEEARHSLIMVADRLLLDGHATGGQPGIVRTRLGQLPAPVG